MALIAEEIVNEWLNRKGYFTMRGVKLGVQEMDILAVKYENGKPILRHYEVQASMRPASYISQVPKAIQKRTGRKPNDARRRSKSELATGVREWIDKKFRLPNKKALRERLVQGQWSFHLVVHIVRHQEELEIFNTSDEITVVHLKDILDDLLGDIDASEYVASSKDLIDLMKVGRAVPEPQNLAIKVGKELVDLIRQVRY